MYDAFFGLTDRPFQLTPDPRFWYDTATHKKAMAYLGYGLAQGEGFIVITGDIGAGKTTLVGHLMDRIDPGSLNAIQIVSTAVKPEDLLRIVAQGLDVDLLEMIAAAAGERLRWLRLPWARQLADLARGDLPSAWARSRGEVSPQLSLLIASSESAEPSWGRLWLEEARAKHPELMASPYAMALAAREGLLRGEPLRQALAKSPQFKETPAQLIDFLVAVAAGQADAASDQRLNGVQLELRGLALNLAQVMLRDKTPPAWRRQARALLFLGERPYLSPVDPKPGRGKA